MDALKERLARFNTMIDSLTESLATADTRITELVASNNTLTIRMAELSYWHSAEIHSMRQEIARLKAGREINTSKPTDLTS